MRPVPPERHDPARHEEMQNFLESVRERLERGLALDDLATMDETSFWNAPSVIRSYAPIGRCGFALQ
jgi:hypothetical protein